MESPSRTIKGHTVLASFTLKSDTFDGVAEIWTKNGRFDFSYEGMSNDALDGLDFWRPHWVDTNIYARSYEQCFESLKKFALSKYGCQL